MLYVVGDITGAVGEPCTAHGECGQVHGSGAICGTCGVCQCRLPGHVPDILGTKCGPGNSDCFLLLHGALYM